MKKQTKFKCDCCRKEFPKDKVIIECLDCYTNGVIEELTNTFHNIVKWRMCGRKENAED